VDFLLKGESMKIEKEKIEEMRRDYEAFSQGYGTDTNIEIVFRLQDTLADNGFDLLAVDIQEPVEAGIILARIQDAKANGRKLDMKENGERR
jgi:hypothetical protein